MVFAFLSLKPGLVSGKICDEDISQQRDVFLLGFPKLGFRGGLHCLLARLQVCLGALMGPKGPRSSTGTREELRTEPASERAAL